MSRMASNPVCLAGTKLYPQAQKEFDRIRKDHRTLAPTGCTAQFCQAGRATHINEPRVGRDRPVKEVQEEAANFLRECRDNGIIDSPKALCQRIQQAFSQIEASAIETTVTDANGHQFEGRAGGTWEQTQAELTYGLRVSWRNARRCIMRSEYATLNLVDLRHITTSREMAIAVIEGTKKAYNKGLIQPSVFLFPPRQPGERGPMVWNSQILGFAGYQDDGEGPETILGDPANVDLTRSIIDLGWVPPFPRSRWDVLPLVTMAEGDSPFLMELPAELKHTVRIVHPQYLSEFQSLDLRWVVAPALSRLGFDIGGNQYTASPFIGWFMDAEIGVRDLADEHRYNVLPSVVKALKLNNMTQADVDDLPEEERLLVLSRAQAELNFAVHYSFRKENVMMSDSLSASAIYMEYDRQRKADLGYALPADPYWLAPPQGSIIPIWHRGAAPNYQPKPMICRHVQDPVKAWNRQAPDHQRVALKPASNKTEGDVNANSARVKVVWCSAGVNAAKIARRLYKGLKDMSRRVDRPQILNSLSLDQVKSEDLILLVVSTHGEGEVPANGLQFVKKYRALQESKVAPKFSVFGHGDRSYGDTYNAAAKIIHGLLRDCGCKPLPESYFAADSSAQNPDWNTFDRWFDSINKHLLGAPESISKTVPGTPDNGMVTTIPGTPNNGAIKTAPGTPTNGINKTNSRGSDISKTVSRSSDGAGRSIPGTPTGINKTTSRNPEGMNKTITKKLHEISKTMSRGSISSDGSETYVSGSDSDSSSSNNDFAPFDLLADMSSASLLRVHRRHEAGIVEVTLDVGDVRCEEMAHLRILCPNLDTEVMKTMVLLGLGPQDVLQCNDSIALDFFSRTVDLERPFKTLKWYPGFKELGILKQHDLRHSKINTVLRNIVGPISQEMLGDICRDMQSIQPRIYSVASSPSHSSFGIPTGHVDMLVQKNAGGRFSDKWLGQARTKSKLQFTVASSDAWRLIDAQKENAPLVMVCTGSGVAPIKAILQRRCVDAKKHYKGVKRSISLFIGCKQEDEELMREIVQPAQEAGLLKILKIVPSNAAKIRVQDKLLLPDVKKQLAQDLDHPQAVVFVCANGGAEKGTVANLSAVAGKDIRYAMQERYTTETFDG